MGDKSLITTGILDVVYVDEEGTGIGPTLEFYSLLSAQIRSLSIWRDDGHEHGLFPAPLSRAERERSLA
jgi:E3 ubiquitin-protein ligase TRIP12